jgi:hypothetical protein
LFCSPYRQLFEIHGGEFKPDPATHSGQASHVGIAHGVFLFRVGEYPLDCLFSSFVTGFAFGRVSEVVRQFNPILPNMSRNDLLAALAFRTLRPHRATPADFRVAFVFPVSFAVCRAVFQYLVVRANDAVVILVVNILVLFEKAFLCCRRAKYLAQNIKKFGKNLE